MAKNLSPHHPMTTANALAATGALFYIACAVLVGVSRPTYMYMMSGWYHGINVNALPQAGLMNGNIFLGFLTFTVVSWIVGYVFASFYNWFAKM